MGIELQCESDKKSQNRKADQLKLVGCTLQRHAERQERQVGQRFDHQQEHVETLPLSLTRWEYSWVSPFLSAIHHGLFDLG